MTRKMKNFRYLSNTFMILGMIYGIIGILIESKRFSSVIVCCISFVIYYLITFIGWRCPKCGARLPRKASVHIEKCRKCGAILNEPMKKKEKLTSKSEAQIIKEYDAIITKSTFNFAISMFVMLLSALLTFWEFGRMVWLFIIIIIAIHMKYFEFKTNRCPNCNHLLHSRKAFLMKCPYCGVKLSN